jgi:hypothetical protein
MLSILKSLAASRPPGPRPPGQLGLAVAAIGGLSMALAAGLGLLGVLARADAWIAATVSRGGAEGFPNPLPGWLPWLAALLLAPGLAVAVLCCPGWWRRWILVCTALVVLAAWAPVLSLAAHEPRIAAPWVAAFWASVCAMIYAAKHRMPCDADQARDHA